ncbi:MAG: VWA domain-containing protein, partial [Desulfobacteraceae bacterium]|nr:VWA domain-containing protein [Desulfobacteraceae bacterium]
TIVAEIKKREEARQDYEKAKQEGKSASLLEQQRPNVFQMNVANIMPGDEIRTELRYTELLIPTDGVYEFAYPTVVGPRYSNQPAATAPPSEKWSQNPYLHSGEAPTYSFGIKVNLAAGVPIQEMACPSHKTTIRYQDKTSAAVELDPSETAGGNRDFILKYRLAGDRIESGLLLHEGEKENFFLLMMQPPRRVAEGAIPGREYIFIVDVSGSMHGYPLDISKKLLRNLVSGLRPVDTFNVLLFSGASKLLSERSLPAERGNIERAIDLIDRQQGGGGTELLPALRRALSLPRADGVSRTIVIATDGFVTVEPEAFDLIREQIGNANFFPFGIGTSVNRHLIEGMARVGAGEPFIITRPDEAPGKAEKFRRYIQYPLLTGAKLNFGKFEAYDVEPLGIPDIFAERPAVVYGKWRGKPEGTISLSGKSGDRPYTKTLDVAQVKPRAENSALKYLWARSRVAQLSDYNKLQQSDERVRRITETGLEYSILTAYTSFVAIDSQVRRKGEDAATVKQPLPLPQGVSDSAVGGSANTAMLSVVPPAPGSPLTSYNKSLPAGARPAKEATGVRTDGRRKEEAAPKIVIEKLAVEGGIPETMVRRFVEQHLVELEQCFKSWGGNTSRVKLTLKWTITPDRKTKDVRTTIEGAPDTLLQCIAGQAGKWVFPAPGTGRETIVTAILEVTI